MTAKAVLQALEHIWRWLDEHGCRSAVMGGLALAAWRHPRSTQDVDLLVVTDRMPFDELLAKLMADGYVAKNSPPVRSLGSLEILQLGYEPEESLVEIEIDLLLADSPYHRAALNRSIELNLPDVSKPLFVLTCEDLILHKLLAGRMIDLADVAALLRANRAAVRFDMLVDSARELGVENLLSESWQQAFPGEPLPS